MYKQLHETKFNNIMKTMLLRTRTIQIIDILMIFYIISILPCI